MDFSYFPPVEDTEVLQARHELLLSAVEKALATRLGALDGELVIGRGPLPDGIEDVRLQVTRLAAPVAEKPHLVTGKAVLAGNSTAPAAFRDRFGRLAAMLPLPCPEAVAIDGAEIFFTAIENAGAVTFEHHDHRLAGRLEIDWTLDFAAGTFGIAADESTERAAAQTLRAALANLHAAGVEEGLCRIFNAAAGDAFFRPGIVGFAETGGGIRITGSMLDLPRRARRFQLGISMRSSLESDLANRLDRLLAMLPLENQRITFDGGSFNIHSLTLSGMAELQLVQQWQRNFHEASILLDLRLFADATTLPAIVPKGAMTIPAVDPAELERALTLYFGALVDGDACRGGLGADGDGLGCRLDRITGGNDGLSRSYEITLELRFRDRSRLLESLDKVVRQLPVAPPELPPFTPPIRAITFVQADFRRQHDGGILKHACVVELEVKI